MTTTHEYSGQFCLSLKRKLIKSFMGVGAMKLVSIPVGLVTSIILARVLGPEEFGRYAFIMALIPLLAIPVSGGMPQLLTREVAVFVQSGNWSLYKGALRAAHGWVLVFSAMILGIFWIVGVGFELVPKDGKWVLVPIAVLMLPFLGLGAVRNGAIKGLGMPAYAEIPQQFIQPIIMLACFATAAWFGLLDTRTAIWGQVSGSIIVFFIASWMFQRVHPAQANELKPDYRWADWWRSLVPFSLLALVSTFNAQIGIIFLGVLSSDEQVSAMRIAERGGQFVILSLTLVNMIIAPYIVRAHRENDKIKLQKLARKCAQGSFLLSLPVALALVLGGEELVGLAFGEDYATISYYPVVLISLSQLLNVFFGSVGHLLSMSGNERYTLFGQVMAVLVNVLLCIVLIPNFGAVGAAIAVSISIVVWNLVLAYFVVKKLDIRPTAL
ncbi:flippase [Marinobacter sp. ATCH36]|uniref:flippase n=1 Tax=Marinobacter sp. ATCH36 TaxID=2945106 RepID=UPI002021C67A|nr:flippase [Marinobacter sp. ATCH36]MCL7945113.1 flippase [Marinobacter sp. ATCH36]